MRIAREKRVGFPYGNTLGGNTLVAFLPVP